MSLDTHFIFIFYSVLRPKILRMNEVRSTRITAPKIDGTMAIPAICGPHSPKIACPNDEPISPAKMLVKKPIEPPLPVIKPATIPIKAPIIRTQIQYIIGSPIFSLCSFYLLKL